jgi:8-oxo-dGTP pyrophosphatase MutT (NUDIX family)
MDEAVKKLNTAGLVVIENRRLLLAFSKRKQAFYLPGGKLDEGEDAITALIREIKEELSVPILPHELEWYCHISAPAYGEQPPVMMEQDCFFYVLRSTPVADAEIGSIRYFSYDEFRQESIQVPGVELLFQRLASDDKVDAL